MLTLSLDGLRSVLVLGAHSDDIEIGCGGAILSLAAARPNVKIHWVVFSADGVRVGEAQEAADQFLEGTHDRDVRILDYRASYFPFIGTEIKDYFERLKQETRPDAIFTHYGKDLHQDHRLLSELTWNTWRDHLVLEYEIPKYDGGLGSPNVFFPLSSDVGERKFDYLQRCFGSQQARQWYSKDTFRGLMRLRGIECNAPEGLAEAFYVRKLSLEVPAVNSGERRRQGST